MGRDGRDPGGCQEAEADRTGAELRERKEHTARLEPRRFLGGPKGNRHGATWVDANCLRACVATLLQRDIAKVPDPTALFRSHGDGWREEYDQRLQAALGIRLEEIPAGACPPIGRVRWLACLTAGEVNHALLANGDGLVYHDPNGHELNGLPVPRDRLLSGLRIVPANAPKRDRWGKPLR